MVQICWVSGGKLGVSARHGLLVAGPGVHTISAPIGVGGDSELCPPATTIAEHELPLPPDTGCRHHRPRTQQGGRGHGAGAAVQLLPLGLDAGDVLTDVLQRAPQLPGQGGLRASRRPQALREAAEQGVGPVRDGGRVGVVEQGRVALSA